MAIPAVKWGLTGCGDIARKRVAPALQALPTSELVAVSSRRPPAAFAQAFDVPRHYDHWRTLLQKALSGGGPMMDIGCHRIDDFSRSIREDREPAFSGKQAREVSRILDLIYET